MEVRNGTNYTAAEVGTWSELGQYGVERPIPARGKLFLSEILGLTGMEVSLNRISPGKGVPFTHRHREHEELYLFVGGQGQFQVDGMVIPVREGTVIRVSPDGERAWRNNSTEDLYYVVIQAKANTVDKTTIDDGLAVSDQVVWPEF